jgi:hypothetical protein
MNEAVYGIDGMILKEKKQEYPEKKLFNATLATAKSTETGLGLNPVLSGNRLATDCLRHGKAP